MFRIKLCNNRCLIIADLQIVHVQSNMGMQKNVVIVREETEHSNEYHSPIRTIVHSDKISDHASAANLQAGLM